MYAVKAKGGKGSGSVKPVCGKMPQGCLLKEFVLIHRSQKYTADVCGCE